MDTNLIKFWDDRFNLSDEAINEINSLDPFKDYVNLAPSFALVNACKKIAKYDKILDYGSGYDWAGIIMSRSGAKDITGVDTSINAKKVSDIYCKYFNAKINHLVIDYNYLEKVSDNTFDAIFTSNVLDVVEDDTRNYILKHLTRILKRNGMLVVGLNYYVPLDKINNKNGKKNHLYIDNVLRLVSLTDKEWINIFEKEFKIINLKRIEDYSF